MKQRRTLRSAACTMTETNATISKDLVKCKKCAICIYTEFGLHAVCVGPCKKSFHAACAGIGKHELRSLKQGLLWMCCECMPAFNEWTNSLQKPSPSDDSSLIHADIVDIKSQISLIVDTLHKLAPNDPPSTAVSFRHSTPNVSAEARRKTNAGFDDAAEPDRTEQNENLQTVPNDRNFSLLLTNIDNATCENDIETLVYRCLGAPRGDCLKITKLVSNHLDCSFLDYISFKVVLKWRWKNMALCASTWPAGIKFREFRHRAYNVWKP